MCVISILLISIRYPVGYRIEDKQENLGNVPKFQFINYSDIGC